MTFTEVQFTTLYIYNTVFYLEARKDIEKLLSETECLRSSLEKAAKCKKKFMDELANIQTKLIHGKIIMYNIYFHIIIVTC